MQRFWCRLSVHYRILKSLKKQRLPRHPKCRKMMSVMNPVKPGIDRLLNPAPDLLVGRVGLVCHAASVTGRGTSSAVALRRMLGDRLTCLFGPEHGVSSRGGAGESIGHMTHPTWKIPVYSLYGSTKRPTAGMLRHVDTLVYDLQDIGARPYTYVSTLREVLEAASEHGVRVVVADRPAPLANTVDGPMLRSRFESFVGHIPSPVAYGMTPAETALWLKRTLKLKLDLKVSPCIRYRREARPRYPWCPPSPAIVSWDSALCFPITVFFEAIPALDHGRGTSTPFQTVAAPYLDVVELTERMDRWQLPGLHFVPCSYQAAVGLYRGRHVQGVRIAVTNPHLYQPVRTAVLLIHELQNMLGRSAIWNGPDARPDFFDKLMGTDLVRRHIENARDLRSLFNQWDKEQRAFKRARARFLLYTAPR